MNPGQWLISSALIFAIGSALWFARSLRAPDAKQDRSRIGEWLFGLHALATVAALTLLCAYFLGHRFEYDYVSRYSSRALSPALTLASTWAGQEGSILLWAAFGAMVGLGLARQPGSLARPAMFFASLTQVWLFGLLALRSPFLRTAVIPADGMGLNPLLEDPWMVIHPPVLFLGYAALVAPFALAAAALVRGRYQDWNRMAWPWTLFGVVTLGAGIALGGVWAYKTLGWGGYWGWDPVENASLVPWLLSVGLVHGLLIERTTASLKRTNLLLAMVAFLAVLGGTYLTRSGVLQDFSVHSFPNTGLSVPLLGFLVLGTAVSAALLALRWRSIEQGRATWMDLSRESALWLGLMTVVTLAVFVTLGTTAPILTAIAGKPASVSVKFYEYVSVPVGILLVLLMALAPALRWSRQQGMSWLGALAPGAAGGLLLTAGLVLAGARSPALLVLTAVTGLALGVNAWVSVRLFRRGWSFGAGTLVHAGIAVMVLGMIASSMLGQTQRLSLKTGETAQALGYDVTLEGFETGDRGQQEIVVQVGREGWSREVRPVLVAMPGDQGVMRKPALDTGKDLYLSPVEIVRAEAPAEPVWLEKNREVTLGEARATFTGFRMESHEDLVVYADLRVEHDGRVQTATVGLQASAQGSAPIPADIPGLGTVRLARIDADGGRVALLIPGIASASVAVLELSTKPLVNLVWIGALIALLGTALAGVRRALERGARAGRALKKPAIGPGLPRPAR